MVQATVYAVPGFPWGGEQRIYERFSFNLQHRACLDRWVKRVKGGTFYLQHPNMRVKGVEVNVLPPISFTPL